MQVLHITDPHLYGNAGVNFRGVDTDASLRRVLDAARTPGCAAILVTGDIVQDDPSGYLRFKSILSGWQTPVLCIPGNHDEPDAMRHSLNVEPFRYCGTHIVGAWQFIMLDSYDPGHVGGRLAANELARLDAALARSPAHAMVCLHHHPVEMCSRWLDSIGLANAAEFWEVIRAHAHVRAVVWGHVHQTYEAELAGVRLFATPSTGAQFLPGSDRYAVDTRPPAYRQFELSADGGIVSEIRWVDCVPAARVAAH